MVQTDKGRAGAEYPWTPEKMEAELDAIAPMLEKAIVPGGRILHCGKVSGQYEEMLCNVSGSLTEMGNVVDSLEIISTGFDTIVAPFLLQHIIPDEVYTQVVDRFHECLKPGGALLVVDRELTEEAIEGIVPRGMWIPLEHGPFWGAKKEVWTDPDHWFAIFIRKPCELPEEPTPVFREDDDGKIFVEEDPGMPDAIAIASELLANPRADRPIHRDGDRVTITAENGRWVFKIVGWGRYGEAVARLEAPE